MRVIVAGATRWSDEKAIRRELASLPSTTTVVYGDAPGADEIGGRIGRDLGLTTEAFVKNRDDYRRFGRGAWKGLNERMLESGVDLVLAFHPEIDASRGTKHLAELARAADVEVLIFTE